MLHLIVCSLAALVAADDAVFLNNYLPNDPAGARAASAVNLPGWDQPNYAGFINIDKLTNSNMFFWFHEALDGNKDAPVLLWLQGGPGASSMFGQFTEIGPFDIDEDMKISPRNVTWNHHYHLLFIDNPVGTGFSFTDSDSAFVTNQVEVGDNLYETLTTFFEVFPLFRKNDFYVTGESYAGKYVPACAYTIHIRNKQANADNKINLKGISIGDGAMDPPTQFQGFGDLLFYMGMVDESERKQFQVYEATMQKLLAEGNPISAFHVFDEMLNGDFYPYPTYYANVTGMKSNYFNFAESPDAASLTAPHFIKWLGLDTTKSAIHVGQHPFAVYNSTVETHLIGDWMRGVVPMLTPIMENYKVIVYSGQMDVILGPPLTENFLRALQWSGQLEYNAAEKVVWRLPAQDGEAADLAGYVRTVGNFTQAVVRGAGHMVPGDQPSRAFDLITRFIGDIPFNK